MGPTVASPESWGAIAAIVGGGGISGIVIAILGYLTAARGGRRGEMEKSSGMVGISALLADADSVTKLSIALAQVALAADKVALMTVENREDLKDTISRAFRLGNDLIDEIRHLRKVIDDNK